MTSTVMPLVSSKFDYDAIPAPGIHLQFHMLSTNDVAITVHVALPDDLLTVDTANRYTQEDGHHYGPPIFKMLCSREFLEQGFLDLVTPESLWTAFGQLNTDNHSETMKKFAEKVYKIWTSSEGEAGV